MIELTSNDPRKHRAKFQEYICMVRMNDFLKAEGKKEIYFYDRGHYDEKAYCDHFNSPVPLGYTDFCLNNRYDGLYILPPWPEILQKDTIRTESPQEAIEIHKAIIRTYLEDGYKPIEVPRVGVKERADFVLEHILSK